MMNELTTPWNHRQPDTDLQRNHQQADAGLNPKRYWRIDEAAYYFAISERTVYRLLDDEDLQVIRIRGCRRVALAEIRRFEEWLAEKETF
jgi:excisionase family DNA binding protein